MVITGIDLAAPEPSIRPNPLAGMCRYICDVHGFTNHVMGSPDGLVFCIECNAALARMMYRLHHEAPAPNQVI